MTLPEMLGEGVAITPVPTRDVSGLEYDSRKVARGNAFFAFPGEKADGHDFVPQALNAGASSVVSERQPPQQWRDLWVQVLHGREALARSALQFYGRPDRRVKLTGVTGTNGKTTTAHLVDGIFEAAGIIAARLGTIDHKVGQRRLKAINTTPESLDLVRFLAELEQLRGTHATLEVSSHALELKRIYGMDFHTVVFTNLSRDHLDFHGTIEAYGRAKQRLFEGAGGAPPRFGVVNRDDPFGRDLIDRAGLETLSFGLTKGAAVTADRVEARPGGLSFRARTPSGSFQVSSHLRGLFNVQNILGAIAVGITYELDIEVIRRGIQACRTVPGRFEPVDVGQPFSVVVDYAHTDDALRNLLQAANELLQRQRQQGRIVTVFGCGGDRDRTKRPAMGEIAARLSDLVIVTSDNPRSEDPQTIINDILVGLKRVDISFQIELDRAKAIRQALLEAREGDIVLLAGKGHETHQVIGAKALPFDDRKVARGVLNELGYGLEPERAANG